MSCKYDCNTIAAVAIMTTRVPEMELIEALNDNRPCIGSKDYEFTIKDFRDIWDYLRVHQPKWYQFAKGEQERSPGLREDPDKPENPEVERASDRLVKGCLHDWMWVAKGGATYENLMDTFKSIVYPEEFREARGL
jgi:hypothetical protein